MGLISVREAINLVPRGTPKTPEVKEAIRVVLGTDAITADALETATKIVARWIRNSLPPSPPPQR